MELLGASASETRWAARRRLPRERRLRTFLRSRGTPIKPRHQPKDWVASRGFAISDRRCGHLPDGGHDLYDRATDGRRRPAMARHGGGGLPLCRVHGNARWLDSFVKADQAALEHVPKKLLEFFDEDMLQLFESERFLFDHAISVEWEAL
jgi:hypothetical protein